MAPWHSRHDVLERRLGYQGRLQPRSGPNQPSVRIIRQCAEHAPCTQPEAAGEKISQTASRQAPKDVFQPGQHQPPLLIGAHYFALACTKPQSCQVSSR